MPTDPKAFPAELVAGAAATEAGVVADLARESSEVKPEYIEQLRSMAVRETTAVGGSTVRIIPIEPHDLSPYRKRGTVLLDQAESFVEYVNAQKDADSRLYASLSAGTVVAVLNDDPRGERTSEGAWRDHRATLALQRTPEWKRWLALNGKLDDQVVFAEHLEECLSDIVEPVAADLVEIARSFTASTSIEFRSAQRLANGETQIAYDETVNATAGTKKNVAIPSEFQLSLAPFHGIEKLAITARLRYRLANGTLKIGYLLDKPLDVELQAFRDVVEVVGANTDLAPLFGTPAPERSAS